MKILKRILKIIAIVLLLATLLMVFLCFYLPRANFGPAAGQRAALLDAATKEFGVMEGTDAHRKIIDTYNGHEPLAQGYEVKYDDDWCATFVSFAAIEAGLTEKVPTECSCGRQIELWKELKHWEEEDTYLPLPGDIIYYDWDVRTLGDSIGWSDHVGIVVGTHGPFIKVIEGNKDDAVGYRYILRWDPRIRGYGLPDFS